MREILFRGKHKGNGQWVFGDLIQIPNKGYCSIMEQRACAANIEVDPETVGQFTGLTDKNGKKIFEGDILEYRSRCRNGFEEVFRAVVVWIEHGWWYEVIYNNRWTPTWKNRGYKCDLYKAVVSKFGEVIGNIHDNPELLGGAEDGN